MSELQWGLCKNCKWWQIEPEIAITDQTIGLCIDEDLQLYQLLVSANSDCNKFLSGSPARVKRSASRPLAAKPVR